MLEHNPTYQGVLFDDTLPAGRAAVTLEIRPGVLRVAADARTQLPEKLQRELPLDRCGVEIGGASGRMLFLRHDDTVVAVEDGSLVERLVSHPNAAIRGRFEQVHATLRSQARRRMLAWVAVALAAVIVCVAMYSIFGKGARLVAFMVPESVDKKIGEVAWNQMQGSLPTWEAPAERKFVESAVDALSRTREAAGFEYRVRLVDAPTVNAFALPGGRIVVYRGLLQRAEQPGEVIGVLAHELTHVAQRHGVERLVRAVGIVGVAQLLLGDVVGVLALVREILTLSTINAYGRDQERDADKLGARMMSRVGFSPAALAQFFERLGQDQNESAGAMKALEWLASHPNHAERAERLRKLAEKYADLGSSAAPTQAKLHAAWAALARPGSDEALPAGVDGGAAARP